MPVTRREAFIGACAALAVAAATGCTAAAVSAAPARAAAAAVSATPSPALSPSPSPRRSGEGLAGPGNRWVQGLVDAVVAANPEITNVTVRDYQLLRIE